MPPLLSGQENPSPRQKFVIEVFPELSQQTIQKRWREINVILRLSMLTGQQMQLDASLNMLCDMAFEITPHEQTIVCFWDEQQEQTRLRIARGFQEGKPCASEFSKCNLLNQWSAQYRRPVIVGAGEHPELDALLNRAKAQTAISIPLFVSNRVMGSLQLFSSGRDSFTQEDAQLLWTMSMVAENLLTREYASEGLLRFAFTDYLTGLRSRGYFEQQLDLELKRAERRQQSFALLMVDLDHFKALNDTYGHHVGDQVLRDVASILAKDMREVDTVARYGGDEFTIILPETTEAGAMQVAQRLHHAAEQASFLVGPKNKTMRLTISIGVAVYDPEVRLKRELIQRSDAALYAAKNDGKNRVVCYSDVVRRQQPQAS